MKMRNYHLSILGKYQNNWSLLLFIVFCGFLLAKTAIASEPIIIEKDFYENSTIRIQFISDQILRIQIAGQGQEFKGSALNRYGFINSFDTPPQVKVSETKNSFTAKSSSYILKGNCKTGELILNDLTGDKVLLNQLGTDFYSNFSEAHFLASEDEDWIGFGDQTRNRIYHRGHIADCYVRDKVSYIPVPYFMSTLGVEYL